MDRDEIRPMNETSLIVLTGIILLIISLLASPPQAY